MTAFIALPTATKNVKNASSQFLTDIEEMKFSRLASIFFPSKSKRESSCVMPRKVEKGPGNVEVELNERLVSFTLTKTITAEQ